MPNGELLFPFNDTRSVREEMSRVMPLYQGVEKLTKEGDFLQWGVPYLFKGGHFSNMPDGRALFSVLVPPDPKVSKGCFLLSTRRERLASRGYEGHEAVEQLLDEAQREVLHLALGHTRGNLVRLEDELHDTIDFIRRLNSGEVTGLPSGFKDLDDKTGGFDGGDLVILASRPSMGKTALALNMTRHAAVERNGCVAVFSLEMTSRQLVLRMIMGEARLDLGRLRRGLLSEDEMERLLEASKKLEDARIFIDDSGTLTVSDIAAKSRRLHREHQLSMIVVDYIQLVQTNRSSDRREQEVAEISRSLKLLAKDLSVPVLALSQLNRGPETRPNKRPMLADLRESGAIEQDADIVLFIYRDEVYDEDSPDVGLAELNIAKQRNGPTGLVKLQFEGKYARFYDLYREETAPPETGFSEPPF